MKAARRITMRFVILLAVVGCGTSGDLSIDTSTPLGAGLTARYDVTQIGCEAACGNQVFPTTLAVDVSASPARLGKVTPFDGTSAWFELTATGEGTATIAITGNDRITSSFTIEIVPVTSTLVIDRRIDDHTTLPDVASPAHALTESALRIAQHNVGPDGAAVLGEAELAVDPGTSEASFADATVITTGSKPGTAKISLLLAPFQVGTSLELDVVDPDAIADVTTSLGSTIQLSLAGGVKNVLFLPTGADGGPIAGIGETAPAGSSVPQTVYQVLAFSSTVARGLGVVPMQTGSTTLDITWGNVHKTIPVVVGP